MATVQLDLDDDLIAVLREVDDSAPRALLKLTVTELYRRGNLSGGKAGQLLGLTPAEFSRYAAEMGISYVELDADDWETERVFLVKPDSH
jgi:predicted HTH domain antitoxin